MGRTRGVEVASSRASLSIFSATCYLRSVAINREKLLEAAQKFVEKSKYDKAIVELKKISSADPNDARTLHKIADLQMKAGMLAEAIDTYDSVGALYANSGFAHKAIA